MNVCMYRIVSRMMHGLDVMMGSKEGRKEEEESRFLREKRTQKILGNGIGWEGKEEGWDGMGSHPCAGDPCKKKKR